MNVLLLTVDDMNGDTPGCFGGPPDVMPTVDRLARQGTIFRRAHVTVAVCQPSRSVMLTGRYPHRNGAEGFEPIADGVPVLNDVLRAADYRCGILGKVSHLAPVARFQWDQAVDMKALTMGRDPRRYAAEAERFVADAQREGRPWFLMANAHDPHRPFHGAPGEQQWGDEVLAALPEPSKVFKAGDWPVPGFLPDLPEVREETAQYLSSSRRADDVCAAVLDVVARAGALDDTLVVFLSDNGMAFPFAKSNCYLHSTRTPLVVWRPGYVPAGVVDDEHYVSGIDLVPTICEAIGLSAPEGVDGRSFFPLLRGERQEGRDRVFTVYHETSGKLRYEMRCVQDRSLGYIWNAWADGERVYLAENMLSKTWFAMRAQAEDDPAVAARVAFYEKRAPEELYDFERDPDALHNLVHDPAYASALDAARARLRQWMEDVADPLLPQYEEGVTEKVRST